MIELRWTRIALLVAAVALCAGTAMANGIHRVPPPKVNQEQINQAGESQIFVTVRVTDTPIVDAIDYLFCRTGIKYTILPGVAGRITLNIVNMPLDKAVCTLAETASLGYIFDGGRYVFLPCPHQVDIPCPPCGAGAKPEETAPIQPPAMQLAPPDMGSAPPAAPSTGTPAIKNGPVTSGPSFYGNYAPTIYQTPPPAPYGGWGGGGWGCGGCAPIIIGSTGGYTYGAPMVLPPPYLRPPSLDRMLNQMYAVHSVPGFPAYPIGTYFAPDQDPWAGYNGYYGVFR